LESAGNIAQNKKAVITAFLFRESKGGNGGKERAIGPFFSPIAVL